MASRLQEKYNESSCSSYDGEIWIQKHNGNT